MNEVVLYGAGGHAKVVVDILEQLHIPIAGLVDDNYDGTSFMGYSVMRNTGDYGNVIITIGSCGTRKRIAESIRVNRYVTAVHPSAIVSAYANIGDGTVIMQGAIVQTEAKIGNHCIINTRSSVEHECVIGDFVHVASGCTICGNAHVGEGTWIGAGTTIIQGIRIGRNCFIGAGSVVVKDIPDNCKAYGVPCRVVNK